MIMMVMAMMMVMISSRRKIMITIDDGNGCASNDDSLVAKAKITYNAQLFLFKDGVVPGGTESVIQVRLCYSFFYMVYVQI